MARSSNARFFRIVAVGVSAVLVASGLSVLSPIGAAPASAAYEADWPEVSGFLDDMVGVYTAPNWNIGTQAYPGSSFTPNAPLMGNGDMRVALVGDQERQEFSISESDMWTDGGGGAGVRAITTGGLTIGPAIGENLAFTGTATASSNNGSNCLPALGIDDMLNTKWCSGAAEAGQPKWLTVDLGQPEDVARWVVKHAAAGGESAAYNTKDFKLQMSSDGTTWSDVDAVSGNTANITDRDVTPFVARYVRLYITQATQSDNSYARIAEFEVYPDPAAGSPAVPPATFRQEQDILNAQVTATSAANFKTKTYVAATDNTMVTELWTDAPTAFPVSVSVWAKAGSSAFPFDAGIDSGTMWATRESYSAAGVRWTTRNAIASRIVGASVTAEFVSSGKATQTFTLNPGETVKIYTVLKGGKDATTHLADAKARVSALNSTVVASLRAAHLEWWKQFWLKSYVRTYDSTLEKAYYGALYLFGTANRAEFTPAGQYPFNLGDSPAWLGDYHTNQEYLGQNISFFVGNRSELSGGSFTPLLDDMDNGFANAAAMTPPHDGILYPLGFGPWGSEAATKGYAGMVNLATYTGALLFRNYQYNQDVDWLTTPNASNGYTPYEFMRALADFWVSHLGAKVNGQYRTYGATKEGDPGWNPISDISLIKYVMKSMIGISQDLGVDAGLRSTWQDIYDNIVDYPTAVVNGKTVFVGREGVTAPAYGQESTTMEFMFPGEGVTQSSPQSMIDTTFNTLDIIPRNSPKYGVWGNKVGYSIDTLIGVTKVHFLNKAPDPWVGLRQNMTMGALHGNGAYLEFINTAMLQSEEGFIRLFPNWYDDKAAKFKRLRAIGAFLVDGEITSSGTIQNVSIMSEKGKTATVLNPWPGFPLRVTQNGDPVPTTHDGEKYTFDTEAGDTYELTPAVTEIATASSQSSDPAHAAEKAVDGDDATFYESDGDPAFPQYFTMKWVEPQTFDTVQVDCSSCRDRGITDFEVETWNGTSWTSVASTGGFEYSTNSSTLETKSLRVPPTTTRDLRIKINAAPLADHTFAINEVRLTNVDFSRGKTVTGFSSQYNTTTYKASNINDGAASATSRGWASVSGPTTGRNEWVTIDLGQTEHLAAFTLQNEDLADNNNVKDYVLYGSTTGAFAGEEFVISSGTIPRLPRLAKHSVNFTPVDARYIKFKGTSSYSGYVIVGELTLHHDWVSAALNKTVVGFSSQLDSTKWRAANINDGTVDTTSSRGWASASGATTGRNEWVTIDLGSSVSLGSFTLQNEAAGDDRNVKDYVLYGSPTGAFAGEEFVMSAGTIPSLSRSEAHTVEFPPVAARYVRFKGTSSYSDVVLVGELNLYSATAVSLKKAVTGFSSQYNTGVWKAANINDGLVDATSLGWASAAGATSGRNEWVKIDLGQTFALTSFAIQNEDQIDNRNVKDYVLYGSATGAFAGEEFVISSGTVPSLLRLGSYAVAFPSPVNARYVMFKGTSAYSPYVIVGELSLYAE